MTVPTEKIRLSRLMCVVNVQCKNKHPKVKCQNMSCKKRILIFQLNRNRKYLDKRNQHFILHRLEELYYCLRYRADLRM